VGIGAPGAVDPVTDLLTYAPNLDWKNVPLAYEFKKHIDLPVHIANDADCAALGEYSAGAAGEYQSVLFITLGTGVGGGLIIGGRIFMGASGYGFEPGHTTLVLGGVRCGCGREGCIEAYASVTALIRQTIQAMALYPQSLMYSICGGEFSRVSGRTAFEAAKQGDRAGRQVVEQYAYYVGAGISSLVTSLRPHAVLVGGGISNEGDYLLEPVRSAVAETIYAKDTVPMPVILKASLGNAAGIIGAALLESQGDAQ
jgi:glucokinase